jgi:hypothetical protein
LAERVLVTTGNTKGGSITVLLTSCLTGLDEPVFQIKTKIISCHTAESKPVKQEVNGTVILPPLVFPGHDFDFLNVSIPQSGQSLKIASNRTKPWNPHFSNFNVSNFISQF